MNFRQQMTDRFILLHGAFPTHYYCAARTVDLKDKGADAAMFVVVGSGLTGLWSSLLLFLAIVSTLNAGAEPRSSWLRSPLLEVIVFGGSAKCIQSLLSMVLGYIVAAFAFGYSLMSNNPFCSLSPSFCLSLRSLAFV